MIRPEAGEPGWDSRQLLHHLVHVGVLCSTLPAGTQEALRKATHHWAAPHLICAGWWCITRRHLTSYEMMEPCCFLLPQPF